MHDIGRSFISFDELKKEIDLLSRFKINVFHWHLTDNQGFRFESKKYPALNANSSFTRFEGQYYTQEQCKELEEYALKQGVIIIPEIDMPGHSKCFTTAMGFNMSSEEGKVVLKDLLTELCESFPHAPYIHMGADEAGTTADFVNEMSGYIKQTLKRKVVVWNKISGVNITTDNLPYVDMTWMWATAGSKVSGMANVDCRYNYTNHFDVFADVVGIYKSNIYYAQYGSPEVAGALTAIWNDRKSPDQQAIISQNNLYANALATGERAWIGGGKQYIEKGGVTLPNSGEEYEEFADWERRFLFYKKTWLKDEPIPYVKQTNVRWHITDSTSFATSATGAGIYLKHTWGNTVPALVANPQLGTTAHATTYVYSPTKQTVGAQIEFQNYGRSENDKAPDQGKWDRKGSRVFVNDTEIMPPVWTNSGKTINSEIDLGNENFPMRNPIAITLNEGWNKIYLKLPYNNADGIRLNKWLFTFVFTDLKGRNAIENLIYSPNKLMSEQAEIAWARISEIENQINTQTKDAPGYYPTSTAKELNNIILNAKEELRQEEPDCDNIMQRVEQAFADFQNTLNNSQIQQPQPYTDDNPVWYTLQTPLREGLYLSAANNTAIIKGIATADASCQWKFVERTDGTFDIVNANGGYISHTASYNSPINLTTTQPTQGWTISKSNTIGYVIITSNTTQLNQTTTNSHSAQLFNWGNGTNTSDPGCKFSINEIEHITIDDDSVYNYIGVEPGKTYTIINIQQNNSHYTLYTLDNKLQISDNNQDIASLGNKAYFLAEGHKGKVSFKNLNNNKYLVWCGKSQGYNNDCGLTDEYNPTYCDWTIVASNNVDNGFWFHSKRANGTTAGSLVIMSSTAKFDAFSDAEGWTSNYSNIYLFNEIDLDDPDYIPNITTTRKNNTQYDILGREEPFLINGLKNIYIENGKKMLRYR